MGRVASSLVEMIQHQQSSEEVVSAGDAVGLSDDSQTTVLGWSTSSRQFAVP